MGRRLGVVAAILVAGGAAPIAASAQQVSSSWLSPASGNWTDPANWSSAPNYPNNGSPSPTYAATIAASGAPYTVTLNNNVTLNSLTLNASDAMVHHKGGTLSVIGTFDIANGTWQLGDLASGGIIQNTTVTSSDAGIIYVPPAASSRLANVTLGVPLTIQSTPGQFSRVEVRNGLTLNGNEIMIKSGGSTAELHFRDTQTIGGNGQIIFDGGLAMHNPGLNVSRVVPGTLTIGKDVVVRTRNGDGILNDRGYGNVINKGLLSAENNRNLRLHGDLTNDGTVRAINGGTLTIAAKWTNNGTIELHESSRLFVAGEYTEASIGTLNRTGGTVRLMGWFDNAGRTTALDAFGGGWELGTDFSTGLANLGGGTIVPGGGLTSLPVVSNANAHAVTFNVDVDVHGTEFTLFGANTLTGRMTLRNASTLSYASGGGSLDGTAEILLDTENGLQFPTIRAVGAPLTFGPTLTIRTARGGGTLGAGGAATINQGMLAAETDGQFITIAGTSFTNDGALASHAGSGFIVQTNFVQGGAGTSTFMLGGTNADDFGNITVTGNASLNGELVVTLEEAYQPQKDDTFAILTAAALSGTYSTVTLPTLGGGLAFELEYLPTSVTLTVVPEPATAVVAAVIITCAASLRPRRAFSVAARVYS